MLPQKIREILFHPQTFLFLGIFFTIRLVSFFLAPFPLVLTLIGLSFLLFFGYTFFKNSNLALSLVLAEILLGGSGLLIEIFSLSIRTWLIVLFLVFSLVKQIQKRHIEFILSSRFYYILAGFVGVLLFAVVNGLLQGNNPKNIFQDIFPYIFLALLPFFSNYFKEKENQQFFFRLVVAFIFGSAIFALFTFIIFSSGIVVLQEPYYKWIRDVAGGKITDLQSGFFRIVFPEHLLIPPLTLILSSLFIQHKNVKKYIFPLLICCLIILVLNLSRGYLLAVAVGFFPLLYKQPWRRWLVAGTVVAVGYISIFCSTYFIASHGRSLGLEVFGVRIKSLVMPYTEYSSNTRLLLLQPIKEKIAIHPLFGSGLGSTIPFPDPVTGQITQWPHYDWGYLELVAEFGGFGFLIYGIFLTASFGIIFKALKNEVIPVFVGTGLLAGLIAFLVMNITAPALFHFFGIFFLTLALSLALHQTGFWEKIKRKVSTFLSGFLFRE